MSSPDDNPFPNLLRDLSESAENASARWSAEAEDWEKNERVYEKWSVYAM
jgi:hypothetical protein